MMMFLRMTMIIVYVYVPAYYSFSWLISLSKLAPCWHLLNDDDHLKMTTKRNLRKSMIISETNHLQKNSLQGKLSPPLAVFISYIYSSRYYSCGKKIIICCINLMTLLLTLSLCQTHLQTILFVDFAQCYHNHLSRIFFSFGHRWWIIVVSSLSRVHACKQRLPSHVD